MNIKILVLSIVLTLCAFCLWACASEGLRPDESAETETAALSAAQEPVSEAATESPPPAENEKIEADGLCYRIEDGRAVVWGNKRSLKKVEIPAQIMGVPVTEIAENGFKSYAKMTELILPEGLTKIGASAFYNCASLACVTLPESLTELGEKVFGGCAALSELTIGHRLKVLPQGCFSGCDALTEIVIPEGVTEIDRAFAIDHSSGDLREKGLRVTLPRSLEKMCKGFSFTGVGNAQAQFCLPEAEKWFEISSCDEKTETYYYREDDDPPDAPMREGTRTLYDRYPKIGSCHNAAVCVNGVTLTEAFFPGNCDRIPDYCFWGLTSIIRAEIPDGIREIGEYAFAGTGLTEIVFSPTVETIRNHAFQSCPIGALAIPGSVRTVGIISGLPDLAILTFGEGVRRIDKIEKCPALSVLSLPASLCARGLSALANDCYRYRAQSEPQLPFPSNLVVSCPHLQIIDLSPENPIYTLVDKTVCYTLSPQALLERAEAEEA